MKPIVSVIITTFERPRYLAEAIESVLSQDFIDLELIIVNDASADKKTEEIILFYKDQDQRIKYIKNERNLNSVRSLNIGLKLASGKYIAILDDDDTWLYKGKLKEQVNFLEQNTEYVLIGTNIIAINSETGLEISRSNYTLDDDRIRKTILLNNPFAHSSVLYRKETALSVGGYDEELKRGKDYDLWLKLGTKGKFRVFKDYWVNYRIHDSHDFSSIELKKTDSIAKLIVIKKYSGKYKNSFVAYLVESMRFFVFGSIIFVRNFFHRKV